MNAIINDVKRLANQDGLNYINSIKGVKFIGIYNTSELKNWFYLVIKNKDNSFSVLSVSKVNSNAKTSWYGNLNKLANNMAEDLSYKIKKNYSYKHNRYLFMYRNIIASKFGIDKNSFKYDRV